jgi:hypothetical protein
MEVLLFFIVNPVINLYSKQIKMKNKMNLKFYTTAILMLSIFAVGFAVASDNGSQGATVKQERNVDPFDGIEAGGAFRIFVTQGEPQKVVVEAEEDYIEDIETEVKAGRLIISTSSNLQDPGVLNVFITVNNLKELEISGACKLTSENRFKLDDLNMECSGAAHINFMLSANHIELDCSGAGKVELLGSATSMNLELSGAANLDANEFETENMVADVSGAAAAIVAVSGELTADVSGAGSLKYYGEPETRNTEVSGAGSIKKM